MISTQNTPYYSLSVDRTLEHVFNRYKINSQSDMSIRQLACQKNIHPNFLADLLNVYSKSSSVSSERFEAYEVPVLVDYLQRSHAYYLAKYIPEIEQALLILLKNYRKPTPVLLAAISLLHSYKMDLDAHFSDEEEHLFPYALDLFNGIPSDYSSHEFLHSHDDTESGLCQIRTLLENYTPSETNQSVYRRLIAKLLNFENDLRVHADIEEKILIPKLQKLEC